MWCGVEDVGYEWMWWIGEVDVWVEIWELVVEVWVVYV